MYVYIYRYRYRYILADWLITFLAQKEVSLEEKLHLVEKVKDCKLKYDAELESLNAYCHWDAKRKGLVPDTSN